MMRHNAHKAAGFTLIEVMIATAIMAILFTMVYAGINSGTKMKQANDESMQYLASLQRTFTWLEQDMQHVVRRASRDIADQKIPPLTAKNGEDAFELSFVRDGWNILATPQRSDLVRVKYSLELDTDASVLLEGSRYDLYRSYWRSVDVIDAEPTQKRLLVKGLRNVKVRVMKQNLSWQDNWGGDTQIFDVSTPDLPRAVEITFDLGLWGNVTRVFRVRDAHGF